MAHKINFGLASSQQSEVALCAELAELRLARNMTQAELAELTGLGLRTIKRLEAGEGTRLETFIRVMKALGISENLQNLIPDQSVRPLERAERKGVQRRRASTRRKSEDSSPWSWGE